ncbi:carbon-nitrogen hydrolase family protein [Donghicola tyrosinivorans]|uniref:Putative amidohydrolase n=1 Tax=Donghicola tyrosinivorans TaxID=1652492 RepID=A0A2T0X0S6_9RHOB|nr:carbon-nitrogen hydrolase family protein [Donghicola tyrosinivorans]PRY92540.1 putative amidohydrolase [Donghicola tyrosinivorans]
MKVAAAAYPIDWHDSWASYADKIRRWVYEAAENGAQMMVFPEYGAMELASLAGAERAGDLAQSITAVSERVAEADALHAALAQETGTYILAASAPVPDRDKVVNRARFFNPAGDMVFQDKQIMTRFEREDWDIAGGGPLKVFDTPFGKVGILICYDSEFPLLGRSLIEAGAEIILVPSATEALAGYTRVRIGAMSRALEGQCVTVMASNVGEAPWCEAVDVNTGMGGVFCPPDKGFAANGVLAEGVMNTPGWTYAEVDVEQIRQVRLDGGVLNVLHWQEQYPRVNRAEISSF